MNTINLKLHNLQLEILKKLVTKHQLRFNDLLIEGLESEHMNYHLKKLMELDLVEKLESNYKLTDKGKNYTSLLDDNVEIIETQPKSSVLLHIVRKNPNTQKVEHLLSKRLRQPYLGKVGRLTGKIRFGETLEEAAKRELYEETGLTAKTLVLEQIYHKLAYKPDGTFVQDNLFYIFFITDLEGDLIEKTAFQENIWLTKEALEMDPTIDAYKNMNLCERLTPKLLEFTEEIIPAEGY